MISDMSKCIIREFPCPGLLKYTNPFSESDFTESGGEYSFNLSLIV
jgi:hypothetical protein